MGRRVTLARGKRSRKDGAAKEGKPQQFHFRNRYIMATETQAGAPRPPTHAFRTPGVSWAGETVFGRP